MNKINKVQKFQLLQSQIVPKSQISSQESQLPQDSNKKYSTQDALNHVGGSNSFQIAALIITSITCGMLTQSIIYGLSFLQDTKHINFYCLYKNSEIPQQCAYQDACNSSRVSHYQIDWSNTQHNFITDYNLICKQDVLISLQGTMYFIGFMLGAGVWLPIADKFGRKVLMIWGFAVHLVIVGFIILVRRNWSTYIFFLLLGFHFPMSSQAGYLLFMETLSIKYSAIFCALYNILDGLQNIWLPFYYQYTDSWVYLFYGNLITTVVFGLVYFCCMPQSPRFYLSQKKFQHARKVFRKIAICNRREMFDNKFQGQKIVASPNISDSVSQNSFKQQKVKMGIRQLCRPSNNLTCLSIIVPVLWFIIVLIYYGINLGLGGLKGDIFLNGILSGVAEFFGYVVGGLIAQYGGRKCASQLMYAITTISLILYPLIQDGTVEYICVMLGKFGASSAFYLIILLTTELFPTIFRGTAFAVANVAARVAGMLAPLVSNLFPGSWFMLLFGVLSGVSFIIMFFIKETKGVQVSETAQQKQQNV